MYKKIISMLILVGIIFCFSSCKNTNNLKDENNNSKESLSPSKAQQIISDRTEKAILSLKNRNMDKFSSFVHPSKGVRFTPYGYVDTENDLVFNVSQIKNFFNNKSKYTWGRYDGSGEPIKLTPQEYFEEFVYNVDFANAEQISYNKIIGSGNNLENQFEVYPNSIIVEYYFSGFEAKYEGMDWQSLRLVFEKYKNQWYIVGIIHNQWTI